MENSTYKYNYVTQIRDLVIGIGRPKIAASIMAYDEEGFLEKARLADELEYPTNMKPAAVKAILIHQG